MINGEVALYYKSGVCNTGDPSTVHWVSCPPSMTVAEATASPVNANAISFTLTPQSQSQSSQHSVFDTMMTAQRDMSKKITVRDYLGVAAKDLLVGKQSARGDVRLFNDFLDHMITQNGGRKGFLL